MMMMTMRGNKVKSLHFFFLSLLLIVVLSHSTFQAQSLPTEALAAAGAASLGDNRTRAVERTRGGSGGHGGTGGGETDNGGGSGSGSGYGSGMPNLGVVPADDARNGGGANRNHRKSAAVGRSCSFLLIVFITFSSAAALIGASFSVN